MAIAILPDAQAGLLSLQAYMLNKWSEADGLKAEDEIFNKLAWVDAGVLAGAPVPELASVGISGHVFILKLKQPALRPACERTT